MTPMIIFVWALVASGIMLIMRTSRYRRPFDLGTAWLGPGAAPYVTRHRLAYVPDRDWVIA